MGNRFSHIADAGADGGNIATKPKFVPGAADDVAAVGTSSHPTTKPLDFDQDQMLSVKSAQKLEDQGVPNPSGTTKNSQEIASEAIQEACNLVAGQVFELINEPPETFVASHLADVVSEKLNEQLEKNGSKFKAKSKRGSCGVGAASASVEWSINETIDTARNITGLAADNSAQESNNLADMLRAAKERAQAAEQAAAAHPLIGTTNQTAATITANTNPVIGTTNPTAGANTNQAVNTKFKTTCQDKYHCSAVRLNTRIDITFGLSKPAAAAAPPPPPVNNNNASPAQINPVHSGSSSLHNVNNHNTMMTAVLIMIFYYYFFNIRR